MASEVEERPTQVEQAATFFWASLVFSGMALFYELKRAAPPPPVASMIPVLVAYAFLAFLIFKIAAGRNWARFLSLAVSLFWVPYGVALAIEDFSANAVLSLLDAASVVVQVMGLWLIFSPPGRAWFSRRPSVVSQRQPQRAEISLNDKLVQLRSLRDQGLISAEEFERKKASLLAEF